MASPQLRERWYRGGGFVLAALTVGLGLAPLWTLPRLAAMHGGGAFLLAWLACLLVIALPLLWLEFAYGVCFQVGITETLRKTSRRWQPLGLAGQSLLAAIALLVLSTASWLLFHIARTIALFITGAPGVRYAAVQSVEAASPIPELGVVGATAIVAALVALASSRGPAPWGHLLLRVTPTIAALLMIAVLSAIAGNAGLAAFERLCAPRWDALLQVDTWLAAAGQACLSTLVALGAYASCASHRLRSSDASGPALVVLLSAVLVQLLVLVAAGVLDQRAALAIGPELANAEAALPWLLRDPLLAIDPLHLRAGAFMIFMILLALLLLALSALTSLVLGLVSDWTERFGGRRREVTWRFLLALTVVAVLLASPQGLWTQAAALELMQPYALVPLAALLGLVAVRVIGLGGVQDHLAAYSSFRAGRSWRILLGSVAPTLLLLVLVAAMIRHMEGRLAQLDAAQLGLGGALLVMVLLAGWGLQSTLRRRADRLRGRVLLRWLLPCVILLLTGQALLAWQNWPRSSLLRDLNRSSSELRLGLSVPSKRSPLALAQRAWEQGAVEEAWRAVDLLRLGPEGVIGSSAVEPWAKELHSDGMAALTSGRRPRHLLALLGLLRRMGAETQHSHLADLVAHADWFRAAQLQELLDAADRLRALGLQNDNGGQLGDLLHAWRACVRSERPLSMRLLREAPGLPGAAALEAEDALYQRMELAFGVEYLREVGSDGRRHTLRDLADAFVSMGLWPELSSERRRYLAELRAGSGSYTAAGAWYGSLILALLLAFIGVLRRSARGPRPVDPMAETLENVEPIDVDTEAVTLEGTTTAGGVTRSSTPGGSTTAGGSTTDEREPVQDP